MKLWSADIDSVDAAAALHSAGIYDYIELYVVPGTYDTTLSRWRALDAPYVVHCPHSSHGFNIALRDEQERNLVKCDEARRFADALKADIVIVHPGHSGSAEEAITQLNKMSDMRIHIENMPYYGIKGELCVGAQPKEIVEIMHRAPVGGCVLDFTHAICTANSMGLPVDDLLREFLSISPALFHLSDAPPGVFQDVHLNLGKGGSDLRKMISMIPAGERVTIETPRIPSRGLQDFVDDVKYLEKIEASASGGVQG